MQLLNDGQMTEWWFIQANDGKMLVNDGAMSEWSYTHFTIINEHFAIINEHLTIINDYFTIIRLKLTIIRSFDHHWEAAPTELGARRKILEFLTGYAVLKYKNLQKFLKFLKRYSFLQDQICLL